MSKGRDIAAASLGNVLELARLRRENGLLSVEHSQGGRIEEGEIYFQDGQPVYARAGRLAGQDALAWLLRWQQVYFSFLTDVPHPPVNIPVPTASSGNGASALPAATAPSSLASYIQFVSDVATDPSIEATRNYASSSYRANGYASSLKWLIPQKLGNDRNVLSLPLTRPQRCIYFLVNGQRTVADLCRTTSKSIQEVERILSELQEQGLVIVMPPS